MKCNRARTIRITPIYYVRRSVSDEHFLRKNLIALHSENWVRNMTQLEGRSYCGAAVVTPGRTINFPTVGFRCC